MAISIKIRELILLQLEEGHTQAEVSENLGVSQSTVSGIYNNFKERGHIRPLKPTGRKSIYSEDELQVLSSIIDENPDLILVEYASKLAQLLNKPVMSRSAIHRMIAKVGITRKKKSKYAQERETEENKKKRLLRSGG